MIPSSEIKTIRPKVYAVLRRAGLTIATSHATAIRGWRTWSRGTTLSERMASRTAAGDLDPGGIEVVARYDVQSARDQDVAAAISALRAAGWTVRDDGRLLAAPVTP